MQDVANEALNGTTAAVLSLGDDEDAGKNMLSAAESNSGATASSSHGSGGGVLDTAALWLVDRLRSIKAQLGISSANSTTTTILVTGPPHKQQQQQQLDSEAVDGGAMSVEGSVLHAEHYAGLSASVSVLLDSLQQMQDSEEALSDDVAHTLVQQAKSVAAVATALAGRHHHSDDTEEYTHEREAMEAEEEEEGHAGGDGRGPEHRRWRHSHPGDQDGADSSSTRRRSTRHVDSDDSSSNLGLEQRNDGLRHSHWDQEDADSTRERPYPDDTEHHPDSLSEDYVPDSPESFIDQPDNDRFGDEPYSSSSRGEEGPEYGGYPGSSSPSYGSPGDDGAGAPGGAGGGGAGDEQCVTVVAALEMDESFPGELCEGELSALNYLRGPVVGIVAPFFISQAILPSFAAGILSAAVS